MYDEVCNATEQAGVEDKLEQPIWVDKDQQPTEKDFSFGRKATHLLSRPDYVLFVNEVGSNVSQEVDSAHSGERKFVG